LLAPPFILEERHVFDLVEKLNATLEEVLPQRRPKSLDAGSSPA
jgi:hypothetical protein